MATAIRIPDMGTTESVLKLMNWLKNEGETVKRGEPIAEIETDKANVELESVAEGVLLKQAVPPGTEIEQGTIIAYIGQPGEKIAEEPPVQETKKDVAINIQTAKETGAKISPLIRNLANRMGVDVNKVKGTGPGGQITKDDLTKAQSGDTTYLKDTATAPVGFPKDDIALSQNRIIVGKRVSKSHQEIPPINLTCRIEFSSAMKLRKKILQETGNKITYDSIFVYAVARTIKDFPNFLCHFENNRAVRISEPNIAFAIGLEDNLFTPVIKNADKKNIPEIDSEIKILIEKAKQNKLSPAEMSDGCFTISNLGMYPVSAFNVIIPPDQSSALAVGTIEETPVLRNNALTSAPFVNVTLSVDHRLINGRDAGVFLAKLKETMEKL